VRQPNALEETGRVLDNPDVPSPTCPACGEPAASDARFCASCGAELTSARRPREERKLVSVLFVDLVGFTARSDAADPEDTRELLQLYHAEAKRRIDQHGGVLEKFIGDAVMAVFGAPVAHGDDAERAVRAGLRVLEGIERLNETHGLGLAARAAVNTGEAVVSLDGRAGEPLATGDVVNTASRLQSAAPVGKLVVGESTYLASRDAIDFEHLGSVDAKGKADALSAWVAGPPRSAPGERRLRRAPMVGRAHEIDLLRTLWRRAVEEQRPHLATVLGPPGIGKSRLCRELEREVAATGRILRGRCLPYEVRSGFQAFGGIVRSLAGILESDAPEVAEAKLLSALERAMPREEAAEIGSHLGLLLGLQTDADLGKSEMLFFYARRLLESLGAQEPTLVLFEDVHWGEPSELELLQYLGRHLREARVLLMATARPELFDGNPDWGSGGTAQTMVALEPLKPEDASLLASHFVPPDEITQSTLSRLIETGGGNPLFLEELAAGLRERSGGDDLPLGVREAIAGRIDALPAEPRSVLLAAAIVGRTFWRGAVAAVHDTGDLDDALATLEEKDLLRRDLPSRIADEAQFTFRHVLIRDVAYGIVPRAERRRGHAAVATYLEHAVAAVAETVPAMLAHHWREAGEPARAIPYLTAAAEAARRSWAQGATFDLYSLAIELAEDPRLRQTLRLQRGIALVGWWEMERAAEELAPLVLELEGQERLDALIALGHAYVWTERAAEALATAQEAAAQLELVADETARGAVLAMESQAIGMRGAEGDLERAVEIGERSLAIWTPGARTVSLTHQLHLHTDATYWVGNYERSVEVARETREAASDVRVAEAFLRGGGSGALGLAGLGRHEEAIAVWEELLPLADELGRPRRVLLNYSSLAYRELYDLDEARRRSEEAMELSPPSSFNMPRQFAGSDLVQTELLACEHGRAETLWRQRWDEADQATGWTRWLIAGRLQLARAELELAAGDAEAALQWAEQALATARRTRRRKYEARSLSVRGRALALLRRKDEALESLQGAIPIADALVGPPARWQARAALGRAAYALGEDEAAERAWTETASLVQDFATTLSDARRDRFLRAPQVEALLRADVDAPA
jgi:class 3 adenylate cyclase/tetratricopeptide (TPR) repeat protein